MESEREWGAPLHLCVGGYCKKMSYLSCYLNNIYQVARSHLKSNTAVFWCSLQSESSRQPDLSLIPLIFKTTRRWARVHASMFTCWILTSPRGKPRSIRLELYWSRPFLSCTDSSGTRWRKQRMVPGLWCPHASLSRPISVKNNEVTSPCLGPQSGADFGDGVVGSPKQGTSFQLSWKRLFGESQLIPRPAWTVTDATCRDYRTYTLTYFSQLRREHGCWQSQALSAAIH